jgi:hypothetical protein
MDRSGISRRRFLGAALAGGALVAGPLGAVLASRAHGGWRAGDDPDGAICEGLFARWSQEGAHGEPIGALVGRAGRAFLNAPYRANTLEEPGEEHVVVNLREFDCVTFYESSLALARSFSRGGTCADDFRAELRLMRYRAGEIAGYASRLHYFSDWVRDNAAKSVVRDVTAELGGVPDTRVIDFMSVHRSAYRQLASDGIARDVARAEQELSAAARWYIPKAKVGAALGLLRTGDVIGITTSLAGLDCSHTGLAVEEGGVIKFLHAPLSGGVIQVSRGSLDDYIAGHTRQTGIIAARPVEPFRP